MFFHPPTTVLSRRLMTALANYGALHAPVSGSDGIVRLQPVTTNAPLPVTASLPRLSLKKYLLPPQEELPNDPAPPQRLVVLGIAPCDLVALAYLDRVWEDDKNYQERRHRLLVVGSDCCPQEQCFCPPRLAAPNFDLFCTDTGVWSGTPLGDELLLQAAPAAQAVTTGPAGRWQHGVTVQFTDIDLDAAGRACLGCGGCSAVCPTCTCFERHDFFAPAGIPRCERRWDNCLFREHGLVAGGHNFRPDRASRLAFRLEHKRLGFGALRGTPSCVNCGRCVAICPANIDLRALLASPAPEEPS